jgi:hypothetical protein
MRVLSAVSLLHNSIATSSKPFQYSLRCVPIYLFIYIHWKEPSTFPSSRASAIPLQKLVRWPLSVICWLLPNCRHVFSRQPLLLLGLCRVLLISPSSQSTVYFWTVLYSCTVHPRARVITKQPYFSSFPEAEEERETTPPSPQIHSRKLGASYTHMHNNNNSE